MIYLPDSNIFSELTKANPSQTVLNRFREFQQSIYIAATVWHEMVYGINAMAEGRKKQQITVLLNEVFSHFHVLDYDKTCADIHAKIRATAKQNGKTLPDSQIAAIALRNEAILVTRNRKDFQSIDNLQLANWFE